MQDVTILTNKITIPTLGGDVVYRPNLNEKFSKMLAYSLTIIVAGAGYGKTTALVQYLIKERLSVGWYNPGPEDDHVYSFSAYLAGALNSLLPGLKDWYMEKAATEENFNWKTAFLLIMTGLEFFGGQNMAGTLVIDDWQYVQDDTEICLFFDRFLACRPAGLHVVIISREPTNLSEVERIRSKGQVLTIGCSDLTFDVCEVESLLSKAKELPVSKGQIEKIVAYTEGWIIAIKLLVSQLQGGIDCFADSLSIDTGNMDGLFEYLAQIVLGRQSAEVQEFLLQTALVESFTISYCKEVLGSERSASLLNIVLKKGLFIYRIGQGAYRYHSLFRDFLCREAELKIPNLTALHAKIGYYYWQRENAERALYFLLLGAQWEKAEEVLCKVGRRLVSSGRDRLLQSYLEQLPQPYRQNPEILLALGDAARYACAYDQAIDWYKQAGQKFKETQDMVGWSHACRGIGETYLDIIQPVNAQSYLKQAYQSLPEKYREEKAAILGLMAENMINHGNSWRAERYHRLMVSMLPCVAEDKNNLQVRILLRTGQLFEGIEILERRYEQEKVAYHVPRSFRESPLVLSIYYTYVGQGNRALELAQEGIELAEKLRSPFGTAVGYMRLGHALLLTYRQNRGECQHAYQQATEIAERMGVLRGQTEAYQGRSLMHALDGDWPAAKRMGLEGIKITETVQDEWFTAVLYHTLGMGAALCACFEEAEAYIMKALQLFERCRDVYGQAVGYWWLTYLGYQRQEPLAFIASYSRLLDYCQRYGYGFLLEKPCMLGDLAGVSSQPFKQWFETLQSQETSPEVAVATKAPLVIQALGPLKVWRQGQKVSSQEWRRVGAKQLLCLLITLRGSLASRDKLMVCLWPDANREVAGRNFKVVLNHLSNVIEPERQPRKPCYFITRQGAAYQLAIGPECQLDVVRFEALLAEGCGLADSQPVQAKALLQEAMQLYQGEYLSGENVDEFSLQERERLQGLALQGAEQLATICLKQKKYKEAVEWTERILKIDSCWEKAYQLQLVCYGEMGNAVMLARTYKRCLGILEHELGVKPSPKTWQIYQQYQKIDVTRL